MNTKNTGMHFERDEIIGIVVSIVVAVLFFAALRFDFFQGFMGTERAGTPQDSDVVVIGDNKNMADLIRTLSSALSNSGDVTKLIIEDSRVGTGTPVTTGSRVTVHYVGMLQDGTQFDNSYAKGEPFSFTVGGKTVIPGWDKGLIGMREGGERILIIPGDLAYGNRAVGAIPANATLLFAIELLQVE